MRLAPCVVVAIGARLVLNVTRDSGYTAGMDGTYAQNYQDTWMMAVAKRNGWDQPGKGFILDMGAYHGTECSNSALLEKLREDYERISKEFEALKYSGEARNTSNQRILTEFEQHLTNAESKKQGAEDSLTSSTQMLVRVKTGIDHLHLSRIIGFDLLKDFTFFFLFIVFNSRTARDHLFSAGDVFFC